MARKLRVEHPGAIYHPLALREAHGATNVMNSDSVASRSWRPARADLPGPCGAPVSGVLGPGHDPVAGGLVAESLEGSSHPTSKP